MTGVSRIGAGILVSTVIAGLCVVAWLTISSRERPPETTSPMVESWAAYEAPPTDFVGSKACAKCHAQIYEQYMAHPMANTMSPIEVASALLSSTSSRILGSVS